MSETITLARRHFTNPYQFNGEVSVPVTRVAPMKLLCAVGLIAACSSSNSSSNYTMYKVSGDAQSAVAGAAVANPPTIQVLDDNGVPDSGATVVFAVVSGGGSVTGGTVKTGINGSAAPTSWTLGTTPGVNSLTATADGVSGSPVTFTATTVVIGSLVKVSGDAQTGRAGTTLINPVVVKTTDQQGNPISGVVVNFSVTAGGGFIGAGGSQHQVVTDGTGSAAMQWNLGTTAGTNTMLVFVSGTGVTGNNATFTATGT